MIIDCSKYIKEIENNINKNSYKNNDVWTIFYENILKKICWNSNAIEGNTLTLDETIRVLDYDETNGHHKYNEYFEAKCLYRAINNFLKYDKKVNIDEKWICDVNSTIMGKYSDGEKPIDIYRKEAVGVGNIIAIDYVAPDYQLVPELVKNFIKNINNSINNDVGAILRNVTIFHLEFERIHPFLDGNGRTGRLILNQMLMNNNLLPLYFLDNSAYRNSFKIYNNSNDSSKLLYLICKGEINSINFINNLIESYNKNNYEMKKILEDKN